jgi:integrase/recombinase XerD
MSKKKSRRAARVSVPPSEWPHGAAAAWVKAETPRSLFSAPNASADWRPATKLGVEGAYRYWMLWSVKRQTFPADIGFADRVTRSEIEAYVSDLRSRIGDISISTYLAFLKMALVKMAPCRDWAWMEIAISSLKRSAVPVRRKRRLIVPMHDLVNLGLDLMASCAGDHWVASIEQAATYRDGIMIALLAMRPHRQKQFASILIGETLIERNGSYWLKADGSETKNGEDIYDTVPEFLHDSLRFYLDQARPVLALGRHGMPLETATNDLWLTTLGSPLRAWGTYRAITARTKDHFGHPINPHLFRDCLATTMANEDPDNAKLIKFCLGHLNSAIADQHYIHGQATMAMTRVSEHVLALRARSRSV